MNTKASHTFLVLILCCISVSCYCQGDAFYKEDSPIASINTPVKKAPLEYSNARSYKRFPQLFSGMAIEIATSTYPMDKSNPIFRQFGNVFYEKLSDGGYSYLIMANFSSKDAGLEFLKNVVKPKAEKARLIQYSEGNRKVIRE